MTMTREERIEKLASMTNEEVVKMLQIAISFMTEGTLEETRNAGKEVYELVEAEIIKRMSK